MGAMTSSPGQRSSFLLSPLAQIVFLSLLAALLFVLLIPRVLDEELSKKAASPLQARLESVDNALRVFGQQAGRYPTTYEGLRALIEKPAALPSVRWSGPYLYELPTDPWGQELIYVASGAEDYDLISAGPDRTLGTRDDVSRSAQQRKI